MEYGAKLVGQILRLIQLQRDSAVAQIDDSGRFLFSIIEQGVGFRSGE